jgi:hypothetical protein
MNARRCREICSALQHLEARAGGGKRKNRVSKIFISLFWGVFEKKNPPSNIKLKNPKVNFKSRV